VACDPDVNYENRVLFEYERAYAKAHDNLRAKLFISVSSGNPTPRKEFASILEKRDYEDLTILYKEMLNCQHCELVGPSFHAGLKAVFG